MECGNCKETVSRRAARRVERTVAATQRSSGEWPLKGATNVATRCVFSAECKPAIAKARHMPSPKQAPAAHIGPRPGNASATPKTSASRGCSIRLAVVAKRCAACSGRTRARCNDSMPLCCGDEHRPKTAWIMCTIHGPRAPSNNRQPSSSAPGRKRPAWSVRRSHSRGGNVSSWCVRAHPMVTAWRRRGNFLPRESTCSTSALPTPKMRRVSPPTV